MFGPRSGSPRRTSAGSCEHRTAADEIRSDGQRVDGSGAEALKGVPRVVDHGTPGGVERRVDDHGDAGAMCERVDAPMHEGFVVPVDGLDPRGAVDVHYCRDLLGPSLPYAMGEEHELTRDRADVEDVLRPFDQDHGRDGPELFPAFDVVEPPQVLGAG